MVSTKRRWIGIFAFLMIASVMLIAIDHLRATPPPEDTVVGTWTHNSHTFSAQSTAECGQEAVCADWEDGLHGQEMGCCIPTEHLYGDNAAVCHEWRGAHR